MSEDNSGNTSFDRQSENGHGELNNDMNYNEVKEEPTLDEVLEVQTWESELIDFVKARVEDKFQLEMETAKVEAVSAALDKAEKEFQDLLEQSRSEWESISRDNLEESIQNRLKQACDEAAALARRDAESQIDELSEQLEGSRKALTLAVASAQTTKSQASAFDTLRDAISDIDAKRSQSETLSALVESAHKFAPRVALFVVKSGNAIGWKAKGFDNGLNDETVKSLNVPLHNENIINRALNTYATAISDLSSQQYSTELSNLLGEFASHIPEKATAFPLIVKGKAAAALYADSGNSQADEINTSAIESLMRATGMGVELLKPRSLGELYQPVVAQIAPSSLTPPPKPVEPVEQQAEVEQINIAPPPTYSTTETGKREVVTAEISPQEQSEITSSSTPGQGEATTSELPESQYIEDQPNSWNETAIPVVQAPVQPQQTSYTLSEVEAESYVTAAASPVNSQTAAREEVTESFAEYINRSPNNDTVNKLHVVPPVSEPVYEPVYEPVQPPVQAPSPASETEQRAHNYARRFARLLVSEIKLYNAAKVNEGRKNYDIYDRLQEDIDRSRKVYDKRVSPSVAARFDYFYDELVQTLAEGDSAKLGPGCPGPFVLAS